MENKTPNFLYHYTTINTLGYILKNKNIRFNNLVDLDDIDEGIFANSNWGKYCFVSCWTDEEKESIEMWKMYSNDMNGVRVRLKSYPFYEYPNESNDNRFVGSKSLVPISEILNKDYCVTSFAEDKILYKVIYNSIDFLDSWRSESIININSDTTTIDGGKLGIYKNDYWIFQKEWRYILRIYPFNVNLMENNYARSIALNNFKNLIDLPFKDYYLKLDDKAFMDMEILLGPKTNEIDKKIVELLVAEYNPNAKIYISNLNKRIR